MEEENGYPTKRELEKIKKWYSGDYHTLLEIDLPFFSYITWRWWLNE